MDEWHSLCGLSYVGGSYLCGKAKRLGDIHLVTTKDRVDVSSCLTQLSCKPLDRCVWQRVSINSTSLSDKPLEELRATTTRKQAFRIG